MKKILLSLFSILLSCSIWAYDVCIDDIYYNLNTDKKEASVTYKEKNYSSYSKSVIIPSSVTYSDVTYVVTSIGDYAFNYSSVTAVEIPNSVTRICSHAFASCSKLTSIDIPDGVTWIGESAFNKCSGLTSIEIPNSITSISSNVFYECKNLASVLIPNSVTIL